MELLVLGAQFDQLVLHLQVAPLGFVPAFAHRNVIPLPPLPVLHAEAVHRLLALLPAHLPRGGLGGADRGDGLRGGGRGGLPRRQADGGLRARLDLGRQGGGQVAVAPVGLLLDGRPEAALLQPPVRRVAGRQLLLLHGALQGVQVRLLLLDGVEQVEEELVVAQLQVGHGRHGLDVLAEVDGALVLVHGGRGAHLHQRALFLRAAAGLADPLLGAAQAGALIEVRRLHRPAHVALWRRAVRVQAVYVTHEPGWMSTCFGKVKELQEESSKCRVRVVRRRVLGP